MQNHIKIKNSEIKFNNLNFSYELKKKSFKFN